MQYDVLVVLPAKAVLVGVVPPVRLEEPLDRRLSILERAHPEGEPGAGLEGIGLLRLPRAGDHAGELEERARLVRDLPDLLPVVQQGQVHRMIAPQAIGYILLVEGIPPGPGSTQAVGASDYRRLRQKAYRGYSTAYDPPPCFFGRDRI